MHESWDALELYVMGRSTPEALARIEEHLLVCRSCQATVEQVQNYVELLRRGLVQLEGLVELHAMPMDMVAIRVYEAEGAWVGRVSGANLDTGVSARTRERAIARSRAAFRELFPDHDCGPSCRTF